MAALRGAPPGTAVGATALAALWPDDVQRERVLASLVADGLAVEDADPSGARTFGLPS